MKKVLLATTGLVGAALVASAASADSHTTPKVTVGGFIDFQAGILSDDLDGAQRSTGFRNDTEISFSIDGKSASGLGYGAVIDLEADVSGDEDGSNTTNDEGVNAARTYIYLEDSWGRFELGSNEGVANTMAVDADDIAAATGGINGDWVFFANVPTGGLDFITRAANITEHGATTVLGDESFDNANKITYYTPSFSGFQAGVSYSPDATDRGQTVTLTDSAASYGEVLELAANYSANWDEVSLDLGATYQTGEADTGATVEDLDSYTVGAIVGFAGFDFAASYGDAGDSLNANGLDSDYYSLGVAYDAGSFGLSATYLDSTVETGATTENEFENLVLGADYALAPGLTPYAEVSFFEFDGAGTGAANDNEGTVFLLGTQLAF